MQTDHAPHIERTPHYIEPDMSESDPPISLSHFTHVLHRYRLVIFVSLATLALAYLIVAVALYLFAPAQRTTVQAFRLDFEGAGEGKYPNGTKFNIADIIG